MVIYWKYLESSKMLVVPASTAWCLSCEPDRRGTYTLMLQAGSVRLPVDDGRDFVKGRSDFAIEDMREYVNSVIDEVLGCITEDLKVLDLEEIKEQQRAKYFGTDEDEEEDEEDEDGEYYEYYDEEDGQSENGEEY